MKLHHEHVTGESQPERWIYLLHGIFGAGRNWGSVARRVVRERPEWGAVLVDLRQHGASQGFAEPHTVEAAARDLLGLSPAPAALLGHSFGGKVALLAAAMPEFRDQVRDVWLIDSTPEARAPEGSAHQMLQLIQALPDTFGSREQLVTALTNAGIGQAVALWMATNLVHEPVGYRWRFDRDAMQALLTSFFDTDAWHALENPAAGQRIHVVRASRGSVLDEDAARRVQDAGPAVHLHQVEGGHWLNADNPDSVVALLVSELP